MYRDIISDKPIKIVSSFICVPDHGQVGTRHDVNYTHHNMMVGFNKTSTIWFAQKCPYHNIETYKGKLETSLNLFLQYLQKETKWKYLLLFHVVFKSFHLLIEFH